MILNNGQLAQVPLAKLCPRKFSDAINDKSDSESRNSNSSICSQSTNNEEDSDQMTSSNEKLEVASTASTTSSIDTTKPETKANANSQLLNICIDCYQLTVSFKSKRLYQRGTFFSNLFSILGQCQGEPIR